MNLSKDLLHLRKTKHAGIGKVRGKVARVDDISLPSAGRDFTESRDSFNEFHIESHGRFDLYGDQLPVPPEQQVDFIAPVVTVEIEFGFFPRVESVFQGFDDDHVLEEIADQRVPGRLRWRFDTEQVGSQSDVGEIDLRRFDDALAEVLEIGIQPEDGVRRFQHRQPFLQRGARHAQVACQSVEVQHLADAAGQQAHEVFEIRQPSDVYHLPDVALDVSLTVVAVEPGRIDVLVVQPRHESLVDVLVSCALDAGGFEFRYRQGQQAQEGGSAGQGLGNRFLQTQLVAARENELPAFPAAVGEDLDDGQQFGYALDLVDDDRRRKLGEEGVRIAQGKLARIGRFQVRVGVPGEMHPCQRGFARLPRPDDGDNGEFCRCCCKLAGDLS